MSNDSAPYDAVVIGAGISGIYALHQLREKGFRVVAIDAAPSVGGTWYWNNYPGARVDIESIEFSYSFDDDLQQDWTWSTRYAGQPELLRYLRHVVHRYDLARDIRLNVRIVDASFNASTDTWTLSAEDGENFVGRHVILAVGALSAPKVPAIAGLDQFEGDVLQTIRWPKQGYDMTGKRVGVVGTGATGVQIVTALAPTLGPDLFVFQRTAPYVVPRHNSALPAEFVDEVKANYAAWREAEQAHFGGFVALDYKIGTSPTVPTMEASAEERTAEFEMRWSSGGLAFYSGYFDLLLSEDANAELAAFLQRKIRERVAGHPQESRLVPYQYLPLTRRLIVEDGYFESYTQYGATLVPLDRGESFELVENGALVNGELIELDTLVLATGFEGVTGAAAQIDIGGINGEKLRDAWRGGPATMLGYLVDGFPNMYLVNGAGCPGALTQAFTLGEFQVDWIVDLLVHARVHDNTRLEASPAAQKAWTDHLAGVLNATLFPRSASWYMGTNVEGRSAMAMLYLGGFPAYKRHSLEQRDTGYPDVVFDSDASTVRGDPAFSL